MLNCRGIWHFAMKLHKWFWIVVCHIRCYSVYPRPGTSVNKQTRTAGRHITWHITLVRFLCVCVCACVPVCSELAVAIHQRGDALLHTWPLLRYISPGSLKIKGLWHSRNTDHLFRHICLVESGNVGSKVDYKLHNTGRMVKEYLEYRSSSPQMSSSPSSACLEASGADCSHRKLCLEEQRLCTSFHFIKLAHSKEHFNIFGNTHILLFSPRNGGEDQHKLSLFLNSLQCTSEQGDEWN